MGRNKGAVPAKAARKRKEEKKGRKKKTGRESQEEKVRKKKTGGESQEEENRKRKSGRGKQKEENRRRKTGRGKQEEKNRKRKTGGEKQEEENRKRKTGRGKQEEKNRKREAGRGKQEEKREEVNGRSGRKMSPRTLFEQELKILREKVKEMSLQVEAAYGRLFKALEDKDPDTVRKLMQSDHEIRNMERTIESGCLSLMIKQQPVAGDLRTVSASLKAVTDIERAGNHVSDIAELLLRLNMRPAGSCSEHLPPMIHAVKEMLHAAVEAFTDGNVNLAKEVIAGDDVVDELFNKVKKELTGHLRRGTKDADECIDTLMIAKYLEKTGDHAVNIAEWGVFRKTGNIGDTRLL